MRTHMAIIDVPWGHHAKDRTSLITSAYGIRCGRSDNFLAAAIFSVDWNLPLLSVDTQKPIIHDPTAIGSSSTSGRFSSLSRTPPLSPSFPPPPPGWPATSGTFYSQRSKRRNLILLDSWWSARFFGDFWHQEARNFAVPLSFISFGSFLYLVSYNSYES
jgi:hypothetical protein